MVPSEFNVSPVANGRDVSVTSAGKKGTPFKVSFANTDGVVPPVVPLIGERVSATASIVVTTTLVVVALHPNTLVNVKLTLPKDKPVMIPALVTVAIVLSLLIQVPPDIGDKFVVNPTIITVLPVTITTGNASIVKVTVAVAFVVQGVVANMVYV